MSNETQKPETPVTKAKAAPKTGMYNVEFLNDFGSYEKGAKAVYHASTAVTLAAKGIVKLGSKLKTHKPKTIKDAEE